MATRLPITLTIIFLSAISNYSKALSIQWTGRYFRGVNTFTTAFHNINGRRVIGFNILDDLDLKLGLSQSGPAYPSNHHNLLALMVYALGEQINASRSQGTPPQLNPYLPVFLDIFPLHWMRDLPFLTPIVIDQLQFIGNAVFVNLGHPAPQDKATNAPNYKFYMGVILYYANSTFHIIVTNYTLSTDSVNATIVAATATEPPTTFNSQSHFHAQLNPQNMATVTGLSIPSNWPANQVSNPMTVTTEPVSGSSGHLLGRTPGTVTEDAPQLLRWMLLAFCCYCCRSTQ